MFETEKNNINKLLSNTEIPLIKHWEVSNLRELDEFWGEGKIRLDLYVELNQDIFEKTELRFSYMRGALKQKLIKLFRHYVQSFLNLNIGDVNKVYILPEDYFIPRYSRELITNNIPIDENLDEWFV